MPLKRTFARIAEFAVATCGLGLVLAAIAARQVWLDGHFLPSFLVARQTYVAIETAVRVAVGCLGLALAASARSIALRVSRRSLSRGVQVVIAIALGLAVSELVLRRVHLRPSGWQTVDEEPRRRPDPRLGWTFIAARAASGTNKGGQTIEYAFDANGYRVRTAQQAVDLEAPSILFVGESLIFGDGLSYDDSVPAQVSAMAGTQSINAAVYGYSTDQTFMKLQMELARAQRPIAVVAPFMASLFGRNLDDDRPHLAAGLAWEPAVEHGRLLSLASLVVPFRRTATVEHGIVTTRDVLRAIVALAQSRRAMPLIVVPRIGGEDATERSLRERILDAASVPYVTVDLDSAWHIPWDHHPDARGAHAIAAAIAAKLQEPR